MELLTPFLPFVNAVSGALLGATFYVLTKTQPYLVDRTFDPKYNSAYIARLITGCVGGMILALGIGPALEGKLGSGTGATLTPGVLAILGGYSAEVVQQVLQRLADILLAIIQGAGSAQTQAKADKAQTQKTAEATQMLAELEAQGTDPAHKDKIQKIRNKLK